MSESRFFFFRSLDHPREKHAINLTNVVGYAISTVRGGESSLLEIAFENVTQVFEVYIDVALKFKLAMEEYHGGEVL